MGLVVNTHQHISNEVEGRRYLPKRQVWHVCMDWAYAGWGGNPADKIPPYKRDPSASFERQGLRYADPTGEWTIGDMDQAGVDASILPTIDYDLSWGEPADITIEEKHEHLSELQERYPGRFFGLAGQDARRPGAEHIFGRAIRELGLKGLKQMPKTGYYAWDTRACRLYERCLDYGVPAAICTQPDGGGYNRDRFAQPVHLSDVVGDYPDLNLVILHAGAPLYHWFEEALNVASRAPNVYLSLDFWIAGFYPIPGFIPSFMSGEESVIKLLTRVKDVIGANRMMWGSDTFSGPKVNGNNVFGATTPFGLKEVVDWLKGLPETAKKYNKSFNSDEADLLLGENAARVFGIQDYPDWERTETYGWRRRNPIPYQGGLGG